MHVPIDKCKYMTNMLSGSLQVHVHSCLWFPGNFPTELMKKRTSNLCLRNNEITYQGLMGREGKEFSRVL